MCRYAHVGLVQVGWEGEDMGAEGVSRSRTRFAAATLVLATASLSGCTWLSSSDGTTVTSTDIVVDDQSVLATWIIDAFDVEPHLPNDLLADGAPWVGPGATADAFIEGLRAYVVHSTNVGCINPPPIQTCEVRWRDRWTDAVPGIDAGVITVTAEIGDGQIVAFRAWEYSTATTRAFDSHLSWLDRNRPAEFARSCRDDPRHRACGRLLVSTVQDWAADLP
jgi:hypothetical protein